MPMQLTFKEQDLIDKIVRQEKRPGADAVKEINKRREHKDAELIDKSSIYRFIQGDTHRRGRKETRGRKKVLSKGEKRHLDRTRA
eukprot:12405487-Karenia_brevis.AAC.1